MDPADVPIDDRIMRRRRDIRDGLRDSLPILPAVAPFAAIFGALAVQSGLSGTQALLASALIYAGASQYAMLDLMGQSVPAWSILLAVLAINARHLLYSAALSRRLNGFAPWQRLLGLALLVDPQFAAAEQRARSSGGLQPAYYFAYAALVYFTWIVANTLGVWFGPLVADPAALGLDFILPIYFLSLIMGFRHSTGFVSLVLISAGVALLVWHTLGSPWHIMLGGLSGVLLAACRSQPA